MALNSTQGETQDDGRSGGGNVTGNIVPKKKQKCWFDSVFQIYFLEKLTYFYFYEARGAKNSIEKYLDDIWIYSSISSLFSNALFLTFCSVLHYNLNVKQIHDKVILKHSVIL